MIEIVVAVLAYLFVSRVARHKGIKGPVPGILAALSFPCGILIGGLVYGLFYKETWPYTDYGPFLPRVLEEPAYAVPVIFGVTLLARVKHFAHPYISATLTP